VVEQVGCVVRAAAVSPFSKPEYCGVIVGGFSPKLKEPLLAVMVNGAGWTEAVPGA
jgi:hypothetical protein